MIATVCDWLGQWGLELGEAEIEQIRLLAWWGVGMATLSLLGALVFVPIVVSRLPPDYFVWNRSSHFVPWTGGPIRWLLRLLKNLLGALLLVLGLVLLLLPGQGLLTLIIGLVLIEFPGKRYVECKIVQRPRVLAALNWMRTRAGKPVFLTDQIANRSQHCKEEKRCSDSVTNRTSD